MALMVCSIQVEVITRGICMSAPTECDTNSMGRPACVLRLNHQKFYANECELCRDMGVGMEYQIVANGGTTQRCS